MTAGDLIKRDVRLDLFRAVSLWLLFLEQLPSANARLMTVRAYGFSGAAAIFIFVFGYTAGLVYGQVMRERGVFLATAQIVRRAWQVYVAHAFLFVFYVAEISYLTRRFHNPVYANDTNIRDLLQQPDMTLAQGLFLNFQPAHMEALALYVALLAAFAPMLWLLLRSPFLALAASATLYALSREQGWNLAAFPTGTWPLNPFTWQLLFLFGAWFGVGGGRGIERLLGHRVVVSLAAAYLIFALAAVMMAYVPALAAVVPWWLDGTNYPIDRTNIDLLVIAHVLSIAIVAVWLVPEDWAGLKSRALAPVLLCGRYSLATFCLGVFLAFAGWSIFVQLSNATVIHVMVGVVGVALMIALAQFLAWFETVPGRHSRGKEAALVMARARDRGAERGRASQALPPPAAQGRIPNAGPQRERVG